VTHGLDTSFLLAVEIVEHAHHADALRLLTELLAQGDRMAIAPQVLAEFVHVVTDERRFQQPFSMETALNKSEHWWRRIKYCQPMSRLRFSILGCGAIDLGESACSTHCSPRRTAQRTSRRF